MCGYIKVQAQPAPELFQMLLFKSMTRLLRLCTQIREKREYSVPAVVSITIITKCVSV